MGIHQVPDPLRQGSNWENATFFDFRSGNEALPAFEWFHQDYGIR